MDRSTISKALHQLEDLIDILDNAYWESSCISHKDHFYDLIKAYQLEISELSKLSVDDHYMAYEPITIQVKNTLAKLKIIQSSIESWVPRFHTADQLSRIMPSILKLLTPEP